MTKKGFGYSRKVYGFPHKETVKISEELAYLWWAISTINNRITTGISASAE